MNSVEERVAQRAVIRWLRAYIIIFTVKSGTSCAPFPLARVVGLIIRIEALFTLQTIV